jgi:hypothetical protein
LIQHFVSEMGFDVKRFDVYRKVPKDLTQPTLTGAIISIVCALAITILIVSELNLWLSNELVSQVYVDNPGKDERIPVSITVELPKLKCEYVGLDIQDDQGRHEVGFVDNTRKTPMGDDASGCMFHARFQINKVPGNFHVSTHSVGHRAHNFSPDFTHKIREVRFGDRILSADVPGSFNPLEGKEKDTEEGYELFGHDYIMKIVPTIFESRSGEKTISYQYTYAYRLRAGAALWFHYDLSPLTVQYKEKGEPLFSFLTAICAVVGGVFTVAGIIDGLIFSATQLYQKLEIGKQS